MLNILAAASNQKFHILVQLCSLGGDLKFLVTCMFESEVQKISGMNDSFMAPNLISVFLCC